MTIDRIRAFGKLDYGDPRSYLVELARIERAMAGSKLDRKVRTLRRNDLRSHRERRSAALFCCFMSERTDTQILFSPVEAQDYDFVARWEKDGSVRYAPTQLKEVVPAYLNPQANVEAVISSLSKYTNSPDLSVAVHLNKNSDFCPTNIHVPKLQLASLWVFWATALGGKQWAVCGDLLDQATCSEHEYPAA